MLEMEMIKNNYLNLALSALVLISCSEDDSGSTTADGQVGLSTETEYTTSGSVFVSAIISGNQVESSFLGYEAEGESLLNLDLTQYSSFANIFVRDVYKNYIFNREIDGVNTSLNRYQINKETGLLENTGSIESLIDEVSDVKIIDDETGLFTVNNDRKLYIFNPTTMTLTTSIDLSSGKWFEDNQDNYYNTIIYRPQDNRAFLALYTDNEDTRNFYDGENSVWVEVINLDSNSWEKTIEMPNAQYPVTRGSGNENVDENGNIYITCQGSYGLDAILPTDPNEKYARPQIIKIPANSTEFDPEYSFNPVFINDNTLALKFAQILSGTIYDSNGIAYATISTVPDSERFIELLGLFSQNLATDLEQAELFKLVTDDTTSRWAKLNLESQTVEVIDDMPLTAGFNYPMSYRNTDGNFHLSVYDPNGVNGVYEYNPETNTSELVYSISGSSIASNLVELTE